MNNKQAIIALSQSEKVKSGLIWCSQCAQLAQNLTQAEQAGAIKILQHLIGMIANEVQLARQVSGENIWMEVDKALNTARVMVDSQVAQEAVYHLTQALSQVNRIGQAAMGKLIERGLMQQ
jgi:hypothetical protein